MKIADKLRKLADAMTDVIEDKRRPMTQASTPKRDRQYRQRIHDADNLERCQRALYALAYGHETGELSPELGALRTKDAIANLVRKSMVSNGRGDYVPSPDYSDKSAVGVELQKLLAAAITADEKAKDLAREEARKLNAAIDKIRYCDIDGFFPTPTKLAAKMVQALEVQPDSMILEPSAGIGSLVDALHDAGVQPPSITAIEIHQSLADIISMKGRCNLMRADFLEVTASHVRSSRQLFDRIVMNPPFERHQDIEHVMHAYDVLKPGGKLVALVSAGVFHSDREKPKQFMEFLAERGWMADDAGCLVIDVPSGAFSGAEAFRRTGVACKMVVIDKPVKG